VYGLAGAPVLVGAAVGGAAGAPVLVGAAVGGAAGAPVLVGAAVGGAAGAPVLVVVLAGPPVASPFAVDDGWQVGASVVTAVCEGEDSVDPPPSATERSEWLDAVGELAEPPLVRVAGAPESGFVAVRLSDVGGPRRTGAATGVCAGSELPAPRSFAPGDACPCGDEFPRGGEPVSGEALGSDEPCSAGEGLPAGWADALGGPRPAGRPEDGGSGPAEPAPAGRPRDPAPRPLWSTAPCPDPAPGSP
jgi:hypothetical protein